MDLKVALQLYSIRDAMKEDMSSAFRKVKEMGYDYVEFAGGRYGKSAQETAQLLKENGLSCISVHSSPALFQEDREDVFSYIKTLGARYGVIPMAPGRLSAFMEKSDETFSLFSEMGKAFREAGLQLLYHNHDFEFEKAEGEVIYHKIFTQIPDLFPEPDLCWASYAGVEPASLLRQYRGKVPLVHVKDYRCSSLGESPVWKMIKEGSLDKKPEKRSLCGFSYQPVGLGVEDWEAALSAAVSAGAEYVIVEQDESRDRDPLEAAEISRRYLADRFGI